MKFTQILRVAFAALFTALVASPAPARADTPTASAVAAGERHSLFIRADGTLWAVGRNGYGQLGNGTYTDRSTPMQIATNVTAVAAGGYHGLFVKNDGTLWAMGNNDDGQLGDGFESGNAFTSTAFQVTTGVTAVSGGYAHSLFVKADGTFWAMGDNTYGQLGDNTTTNRSIPVQVAIPGAPQSSPRNPPRKP